MTYHLKRLDSRSEAGMTTGEVGCACVEAPQNLAKLVFKDPGRREWQRRGVGWRGYGINVKGRTLEKSLNHIRIVIYDNITENSGI